MEMSTMPLAGAPPATWAPPAQTAMQDSLQQAEAQSGGGASVENAQTAALGNLYGVMCMCCAACGCSGNLATVPQGAVGLVTHFGRYSHTLPPGRHRFNIMSDEINVVSMKVTCADIPPQAVMTADNLTVNIDAVCYYEVFDARKAVFGIDNYHFALSNLAQVTLRTVLGEHSLKEIFADRQRLNNRLKQLIDEASDPWGIKVGRVEMKAIEIDDTMQRAMAATAEAQQEAEAKIIQAKAQRDAAAILSEAAYLMRAEPSAMQLQWFETLRIIATQGKNATIVLPSSVDSNGLLAAAASATKQ